MTEEQLPVTRWPRSRATAPDPVAWWRCLLAGLAHGLFMYLAFPLAGVWPLAVVAIGPLVWAGCKGAGFDPRPQQFYAPITPSSSRVITKVAERGTDPL